MSMIRITRALAREVDGLSFADPVTHVLNPLIYARRTCEQYLRRFALPDERSADRTLLLGMNPGPWGMAQTGVPFGEVELVRDWMGIEGKVDRPDGEHPKRRVEGFACERSEVSGRRLWGWARDRFGTPEAFFARFFVWNYCPLQLLEETGRNRTPDKLPVAERNAMYEVCDAALAKTVRCLEPTRVVGIGKFAEGRAAAALEAAGIEVQIGTVLHPSPASPAANRGWVEAMEPQLEALGAL